MECLTWLGDHLNGGIDAAELERYADEASHLASRHPGSQSTDRCGHAAVSATYAVANALAVTAGVAADYAAYAIVYGEGGHALSLTLAPLQPNTVGRSIRLLPCIEAYRAANNFDVDRAFAARHGRWPATKTVRRSASLNFYAK